MTHIMKLTVMFLSTDEVCNETFCNVGPCEGAAAPPTCPSIMPECPSGCACYTDCPTKTLICFMTSHCTKIRRFLTKRRHVRASSQDVNFQEVQNSCTSSTVGQGLVDKVERDLKSSAATALQAFRHDTELTQPMSTVFDSINGRAKQDAPTYDVAQAMTGPVERDLVTGTTAHANSHGAEQAQPASSVSEGGSGPEFLAAAASQVLSGRGKREANIERQAPGTAPAAVAEGVGLVLNTFVGYVVFFACFYSIRFFK